MEVFNESKRGSKVHVGKGSVSLKSVLPSAEHKVLFIIDLVHVDKKKEVRKGKVILHGILRSIEEIPQKQSTPVIEPLEADPIQPPLATAIAPTEAYLLTVDDFHAKDLTDTGTFYDPQDPSLTVIVGKSKFSTSRYNTPLIVFGAYVTLNEIE